MGINLTKFRTTVSKTFTIHNTLYKISSVMQGTGRVVKPALTRHALLGDLPVVDLLLHGVVGDEAVDVGALLLSEAEHATHGLAVVTRVPRRVQDNDAIRADQVDSQTPGSAKMVLV